MPPGPLGVPLGDATVSTPTLDFLVWAVFTKIKRNIRQEPQIGIEM